MLQAISNAHDGHYDLATKNSTSTLVAARADGKVHLLLGGSGSVDVIAIPKIIKALAYHSNLSIRIVLTASAAKFLNGQSAEQPTLSTLQDFPNVDGINNDADEWTPPWRRGAPILHIELRRWADLFVVAPMSVDSLAKTVNGMCDDLLHSVLRAWDTTGLVDGKRKRILVAPAGYTAGDPITARHLKVIEEDWGGEQGWFDVLKNDDVDGTMKPWDEIVATIEERLGLEESA